MNASRMLTIGALAGLLLWMAGGCSGVDQISQPQLEDFSTLVVHYGDPGTSGDPCNDALPQLDGVAQPFEWSSAEPLFVHMTGANGTGGDDFYAEIRAIWTDDSRVSGIPNSDRIYFLVRYADAAQDNQPDQLGYLRPREPGEICKNLIDGKYCPSPVPEPDPSGCDSTILRPQYWVRRNAGGKEDQVMILLTQAQDEHASTDLVATDRGLFPVLGPGGILSPVAGVGQANTDVWIWRAGRTNLNPVPQYTDWGITDRTAQIDPKYSTFPNTAGFCEDLWIDGSRRLSQDAGDLPYKKNWVTGTDVPDTLTECTPTGKEVTEDKLVFVNGGIPPDLGLWMPRGRRFRCTSTKACSRVGTPVPWSSRLVLGEYDFVQGWGLTIPTRSQRDVRALGAYAVGQDKGFGVRTIEIMRSLNTGNPDDLVITPDVDHPGLYRMVLGIFNDSSHVGSGSTEIRLQFEKRTPATSTVRNRCGN